MCEIYNFALTIIGSAMVGPFIVCNIIPTICHSYDSLHNKLLNGTYLINPIAATCSVGCVVVQLGVAVAGRQRRGLHAGTLLASLHCGTNSSVMPLLVRVGIAIFMVLWHVHLTSNSTSHAETIDQ